ncbi:unnamed protein product [Rangifer tarandus platyrhynchus]|uniref:Uncharacterized protein n=1 Tax=Rangifer tarandus platyrhynchus TaxID=3082113 RepID=A0AC59Z266_RANTA
MAEQEAGVAASLSTDASGRTSRHRREGTQGPKCPGAPGGGERGEVTCSSSRTHAVLVVQDLLGLGCVSPGCTSEPCPAHLVGQRAPGTHLGFSSQLLQWVLGKLAGVSGARVRRLQVPISWNHDS